MNSQAPGAGERHRVRPKADEEFGRAADGGLGSAKLGLHTGGAGGVLADAEDVCVQEGGGGMEGGGEGVGGEARQMQKMSECRNGGEGGREG